MVLVISSFQIIDALIESAIMLWAHGSRELIINCDRASWLKEAAYMHRHIRFACAPHLYFSLCISGNVGTVKLEFQPLSASFVPLKYLLTVLHGSDFWCGQETSSSHLSWGCPHRTIQNQLPQPQSRLCSHYQSSIYERVCVCKYSRCWLVLYAALNSWHCCGRLDSGMQY